MTGATRLTPAAVKTKRALLLCEGTSLHPAQKPAVVSELTERQDAVEPDFHGDFTDVDAHVEKFRVAWRLGLEHRSRQLLRLEFEATMLEMRDDDERATASFERALGICGGRLRELLVARKPFVSAE